MFSKVIKYGAVIVTAVALVGVLTFKLAPQASAADPTPGPTAPAQTQNETRERHGKWGERVLVRALIRNTAEVSNIEPQAVLDELRKGQSLAQIAGANGSSGDQVVQAVTARARERLGKAIAAGRITQEQADDRLAKVTDEATKLVNDATLGAKIDERIEQAKERPVRAALIKDTSNATGLTEKDIIQRLRNGESLADIATSAGKNSADIVQAATDNFRATAEQVMNEKRQGL